MSYLSSMYARKVHKTQTPDKNPNRVLGGLKGHGADHYSMLGEDGTEKQVPTRAYVQGLEEKVKQQDARLAVLEKQIRRLNNDQKMDRAAFSRTLDR